MLPQQFFDFHSTELEAVVIMPSPVVTITLQRETGLLAVVCDDLFVRIVDIDTQRVVRELSGFKGRILDVVSTSLLLFFVSCLIHGDNRPSPQTLGGLLQLPWTPSFGPSTCLPVG